ncbi:MAG: hypothetical protein KF789_06510 [Bdellovibrionaceae bacterium]|nr:hypothetical protein [Pseudobdellovibrionaceae bacterium]
MTVDDLKEQLQGVGRRITDRLEEIPAYVQMKERFEGLTPPMQKLTVLAVVVVGWLIVLSIPWGWSSESSLSIEGFESRRALIRDLLKVSREAAEVPNIPPSPPVESLKVDVENRLRSANLLPEQVKSIETGANTSNLLPAERSSGSLVVNLSKLNVQQVVEAGTQLSRVSPAVKLTGVQMAANKEDQRYYDVTYRLTALAVPDLSAPPADEPPQGRRR